MLKFSNATKQKLGHYVYALIDPRDRSIFYVGKASANNRAFDHLKTPSDEKKKHERIMEIRKSKMQPEVEILRYGLKTDKDSFEVEAAIIDAIGLENLTNNVRGHGIDRGRQSAKEVERLHGSKAIEVAKIPYPCMLFFINKTYSPTKTEMEIYDATRQFWFNVGVEKRTADPQTSELIYDTALAIVDSVVVRAYTISAWFTAGATMSTRIAAGGDDRYEFVGQAIPDHPLTGRRLTKDGKDLLANQQGYGYIN